MKLAKQTLRTDYVITSPFGPRKSPGGIGSTNHQGEDLGNVTGKNVYALENGTVAQSAFNSALGNFVDVTYPRLGITIRTQHLARRDVSQGQAVNSDTVLGVVGATGNVTGPHLHLGLYINGVAQDPEKYDYQPPAASTPGDPFAGVTDEALADRVIRGEFGNGDQRKNALGSRYNAVQAIVNARLGAAPAVDIEDLARRTIRGEFGNGQDRKNALGANYAAVQARVNQILG
jgi:hypothetical protein